MKSCKSIAMITPPGDYINYKQLSSGSWIELRDLGEHPLYSRLLNDLSDNYAEVFNDEQGGKMSWVETSGLEKYVVVFVPHLTDADHLVLMNMTPDAGKEKPVELARFPVSL